MEWIIIAILSIITQLITGLFIIIKKIIKSGKHAKNKNINIFGNQTIKTEKEQQSEQEEKKLKKEIFKISEMMEKLIFQQKTLAKAVRIYVKNNGANETTKTIIGELLNEKNFKLD